LESLRPDVVEKRKKFLKIIRKVPRRRLVFLDEAGMHCAMTRSHAWVKRGAEFEERVPMNWGRKSLTLIGAIRFTGWVLLTTMFATANAERFVKWVKTKLLPKLRRGDVLILDNAKAHHDSRVVAICAARGVRVIYLPPYSPDFNPIEPGWALQKQHVRKHAPRDPLALRRIARRARYRVTRRHCRRWFEHAGYLAPLR
jgi:transposase